jgi:putative drug exporter of the RND superfamily
VKPTVMRAPSSPDPPGPEASSEPHFGIFQWLGERVVRFRYAVVAVWLIGVILAVVTLPSLSSVTDNNNSAFLPKNSQSLHAAELAAPFQHGTLPTAEIVASRANGRLTPADQAAITRAEAAAKVVHGIVAVLDQGVSQDGQARKALVTLPADAFGGPQTKTYVEGIRASFTRVHAPSGLNIDLTGETATLYDENKNSQNTQTLVEILSVLFIVVLLLLVYRSALAPFLTLLPAVLVLTLAQPVIAESHKLLGVQVSPITSILLIVLLLGAGTDYGLFLVFRVREEMRGGLSSHDAVVKSVSRVGETITFSAGTVMAALLCLLLATFGFYQGLGPALAIGIALMLLSGLTLLPALLAIAGRVAFWPSNVRPGEYGIGLWGRVAARIVRRPAIVLAAGLVMFGGLALAVLDYSPAGFASGNTASGTSQSALGTAVLKAHFPVGQSNPTNLILTYPFSVWDRPSAIKSATTSLTNDAVFSGISGPFDPNGTRLSEVQLTHLHILLGAPQRLPIAPPPQLSVSLSDYNAYRSTAQFISADGRTVQFYATLKAGDPSSTAAMNAVPDVHSDLRRAASASGATDFGVAGQAAAAYDISSTSDSDLIHIVPIVLLVIGALLAVVMRSLVAPWYLLASVGISYLASIGLAVVVFVIIGGQGGLSFFLPFLMFIFLMALGEDYNILVMTRIREEAHYHPLPTAVTRAINATGSTVTSAGMVLAGTFLVLTLAGGSQVQQIGFGIGAGIMMDTFLVRTLLIPSTVVLLGRWNWWPSRMSREQAEIPRARASM